MTGNSYISNGMYYYHGDHLGSATWITDANGLPVQYILYDPWGGQFANRNAYGSSGVTERYTFTGKEFDEETKYYNFEARQYDHWLRIFTAPDPLSDQTPDISPYAYCAWNPLKYTDPTGKSTNVVYDEHNNVWNVVGGDYEDNDLNIYSGTLDENGQFIKGESIGVSSCMTSFYNSDNDSWEGYIDQNDNSGVDFLNSIETRNPSALSYAWNARNGKKYDFKVTNGTNSQIDNIDIYRGMSIGLNEEGQSIYTSARDIGNIAAGKIAGKIGLSWNMTRLAFDLYQSYKSKAIISEGVSSQNAQRYGWEQTFNRNKYELYLLIITAIGTGLTLP